MTRRILFVDDDPGILEGLRNRLRRQRSRWDMQFVQNGEAALEVLAREHIDVIVSDLRMPQMDGASLLKKVRDDFPRVVRIVLSGHAELEMALRAVPVAHQFLTKPCEPGVIENVVERACNLQSLIGEEVVKRIVGHVDQLPSVPRIYSQLVSAMTKDTTSVTELTHILRQDMAMCAKTLQIVNSASFRLSRRISRIEEAVAYLGFNTIKQTVLAVEVYHQARASLRPTIPLDMLQSHAVLVAQLASQLLADKQDKEDAFVAGLLHDIGKLVPSTECGAQFEQVLTSMRDDTCPMHVAEERLWGTTHAEVGAYLLGLWGLPYAIVEAVANHHRPRRVETSGFGILAATHLADALIVEQKPFPRGMGESVAAIDWTYVEALGVGRDLEEWRKLAKRLADTHDGAPAG